MPATASSSFSLSAGVKCTLPPLDTLLVHRHRPRCAHRSTDVRSLSYSARPHITAEPLLIPRIPLCLPQIALFPTILPETAPRQFTKAIHSRNGSAMPDPHGELIYSRRQCSADNEELGRVVRYAGNPLGKHHEQS